MSRISRSSNVSPKTSRAIRSLANANALRICSPHICTVGLASPSMARIRCGAFASTSFRASSGYDPSVASAVEASLTTSTSALSTIARSCCRPPSVLHIASQLARFFLAISAIALASSGCWQLLWRNTRLKNMEYALSSLAPPNAAAKVDGMSSLVTSTSRMSLSADMRTLNSVSVRSSCAWCISGRCSTGLSKRRRISRLRSAFMSSAGLVSLFPSSETSLSSAHSRRSPRSSRS